MNTNLALLLQEIDSLEADINTILSLEDNHTASPDLVKTTIQNILNRVEILVYSIINFKNIEDTVQISDTEEITIKELLSKLSSLLFSKLLFKIVLVNSGRTDVSILLLESLTGSAGIIPEITKYTQLIDGLIKC